MCELCGQRPVGRCLGDFCPSGVRAGRAVAEVGGTRQEGGGRRGCRSWGTR